MRKRARRRFKPPIEEQPRHLVQPKKPIFEEEPKKARKKWWIAISLIGIFLIVLLFNSYFNIVSDVTINPDAEGINKYYLSGPDPYYNLRLVEGTYETGVYQYFTESDPLLNYPIGARGARAPLFNMMSLGFSRLLTPFMDEIDAIGRSMQFIPALFGALLIFPVYFIGKALFNKKAGLIAALFVAIIPIHIGSGHGSAFSLFDHDSFNLLLYFLTFLFLILSLKEKESKKSILYAILGGVPLAALSMTWVEAQFLYVIIAIYTVVQMLIDIFTSKIELKVFRTTSIVLLTGYLLSLPVLSAKTGGFSPDIPFFISLLILVFGAVYYLFGRTKIPWTLSLPAIFSFGAVGIVFLLFIDKLTASLSFLSPLKRLSEILFGTGIYGNKVSMTIAEANTYQISHSVMSFGPALYWLGWAGFIFLFWYYYKEKFRRGYLFVIVLFITNIWLAATAGRFLNDMVPVIAILAGWIVWFLLSRINYRQMLRNVRTAGGGIHGIRRGVKLLHVFGVLFIGVLVIMPNAYVAMDAAVPSMAYQKEDGDWTNYKWEMFGEGHSAAFGLGVGKESYWSNAFEWLNEQDNATANPLYENPFLKPAFISWWDYGFYEVALGGHPTVADNFQDGIPPAANFHTSTSENEAVAVLITRLLQGHRINNGGVVSEDTKAALRKYLGENHTSDIISWIEGTEYPPSRGDPIGREYDPEISQDYPVGQQYGENAIYHDIVNVLVRNHDSHLTDDEITWLYHDLQETTGYSVRYYGVEGYDRQIFNIFAFLSDRSLLLVGGSEDDFIKIWYSGYEVDTSGNYIQGSETRWTAKDLMEMDDIEKRYIRVQNSDQELKDLYFESMFYKTYIGVYNVDLETGQRTVIERGDIQQPCVNMKHFYAEFISDMSKYQYFDTGKAAVVIAKYYEGAYLNGSVIFNGGKPPVDLEVAVRKNLSYTSDYTIPIKHDTHLINASDVNDTGEFNLIAGAGSHVSIRRNLELGANAIVVKEINFDGSEGTAFAPISDDDAMRKSDSNYKRLLNLTIEPANLSGYIYNDVNDDDVYNSTIDTTESGISVNIYEVLKFEEETVVLNEVPVIVTSNESGYFTATGLFPGIYRIILSNADNFALGLTDVALYSGNTTQDISIPKNSNLDGLVYFDEDQDEKYDNGEEIKGAKVELLYQGKQVGLTTTDEDGWYEFESIIPGKIGGTDLNSYNLKVSKLTEYQSDEFVSPEENKTTTYNVSIQLTPVEITGQITHEGEVVEGADINFDKDDTVKDNTADGGITTSNENGEYTINLKPGKYIVNISKYVEQQQTHQVTLMYEFTDGTLTLNRGEGTRSGVDFTVEKKSATVTGTTSYEGSYEEVTITFNPDDIDVNNTAVYAETVSDENGSYSVELTPGTYSISAESSTFEEDNVTYVYKFTSSIVVADTSDKTYDIQLAKEGLSIAPQ